MLKLLFNVQKAAIFNLQRFRMLKYHTYWKIAAYLKANEWITLAEVNYSSLKLQL